MSITPAPPPVCTRILTWCDRRPRRAEAIARRLLAATPTDSPEYPWVLLTLGWCLMVREQLPEAHTTLEQAEHALGAIDAGSAVLHTRHGLLLVRLLRRLTPDDLPKWEALREAYTAAGLLPEATRVQIGQVRCFAMLLRGVEALELGRAIQPAVEAHGTAQDRALLARMLGIASALTGNIPQSEQYLAFAETTFRQLRLPGELARTWAEQATLALQQREDPHLAWRLYTQAAASFKRLDMPLRLAYMDKNLGHTAVKLGQVDRAIAHLLHARQAFADQDLPLNVADCTLNLGIAAFFSGLFDLALAAWRQTEAIYTQHTIPLLALVSRRNQAEALVRLGRLDAAADILAAILPVATTLDARADLGEILQVQGEVLHAQGADQDARRALQHAEHIFRSLPNQAGVARARLAQGWLALDADELGAAESHFRQALQGLDARLSYRWRARYGLGRCAELQRNPQTALTCYKAACAEVAQLRRSLAESHASSALFQEARMLVAATIRLAAAQGDAQTILAIAEQQRAMALQQQIQREPILLPAPLQATYEARRAALRAAALSGVQGPALETALRAYLEILLLGRHAALPVETEFAAEPLDIAAIRADLYTQYGANWTVLAYVATEDLLIGLTLTPTQIQIDTIPLDQLLRRRLDRACLPSYRMYTYRDFAFHAGRQQSPWADLCSLGALLIPAEVRARLHPDHRLLIVPGGILNHLPWAALRLDDQWLVERSIIQIIPGLRIWHDLTQRPAPATDALLIGISQFGERAAALPSARPSLDLVQQHWPGQVRRLEDADVTRSVLQDAAAAGELRPFGLIHIATHGQLISGRGMLAHLKLADDDLLADEIAQFRLNGALVVLAACEGALGETLPGEEVVSLSWALLAGGARDVVASLWQLYDLMVLPLFEPFYVALAAGQDAPTALAAAQRTCIASGREQPDAPLAQPLIWASLCVIGAGAPLLPPVGATGPTNA